MHIIAETSLLQQKCQIFSTIEKKDNAAVLIFLPGLTKTLSSWWDTSPTSSGRWRGGSSVPSSSWSFWSSTLSRQSANSWPTTSGTPNRYVTVFRWIKHIFSDYYFQQVNSEFIACTSEICEEKSQNFLFSKAESLFDSEIHHVTAVNVDFKI